MVRAPCCDKMGLKKGPWTFEEDRILINYINQYGHGNWRALPKQAGLLRCGKSCRLRWMNYLRPDIKRGNFSREEEETIMKLHEMLGNRWSSIAAKLPGRTDNEIKNVWHTHLKKRLKQNHATMENNDQIMIKTHSYDQITYHEEPMNYSNQGRVESPQHSASCTDTSATTTTTNEDGLIDNNYFPEVDENFWSEVFPGEYTGVPSGIPAAGANPQADHIEELFYDYYSSMQDGTDFWFNLFTTSEKVAELPGF